jgi:tRNA A37 threonylcarbamoyladenosine synthetase subunit TsaC/SUA5/YrdC
MVKELPEQMEPLLTATVGKALTVMFNVCCGLVPQAFDAVMVRIPDDPAVAEIVLVELEPLHPPGRDQV